MEEHLRDAHALTLFEYRRKVFEEVLAEWPQRIPAQVLRTRLAAFKNVLCDVFIGATLCFVLQAKEEMQAVACHLPWGRR